MSIWHELEKLERLEIEELERIERWLEEQWRKHRHPRPHHNRVTSGRFAGFYSIDPQTGAIIMSIQQLTVGVPATTPLIFTDASNTVVIPGPAGTISSADPSVTVSLSADGQSANATMTTTLSTPVTLTWSGTGANGAFSFTVDVTDAVVANSAVAGSFGTFVPGTTP